MKSFVPLFVCTIIVFANSKNIHPHECQHSSDIGHVPRCTIKAVYIPECRTPTTYLIPCPGPLSRINIKFVYIPDFIGLNLKYNIFAYPNETRLSLLPDVDGHSKVHCFAVRGRQQNATFTWTIPADKYGFTGDVYTESRIWNDDNEECCFGMWVDFSPLEMFNDTLIYE